MSSNAQNEKEPPKNVVIVGAGIAGLVAAVELLTKHDSKDEQQKRQIPRVTLVEACDYAGGRIRGNNTFVPGHVVDIGAEIIHGNGTALTRWIDKYLAPKREGGKPLYEPYFITAHADGGPSPHPINGQYGMYYVAGELMRYDDSRLDPLHAALGDMQNHRDQFESVGEYLMDRLEGEPLGKELYSLAVAGYGNTAGVTDMHKLSLPTLMEFERYWQEHEEDGDFHLDSQVGMQGVVDSMLEILRSNQENFELCLEWPVARVEYDREDQVVIISANGEERRADAVILTVPPASLLDIDMKLSTNKQEALSLVGFEKAVKFLLKFSSKLWPDYLLSVISAEMLIPEMWFLDFPITGDGSESNSSVYVAVCFLTSGLADEFLNEINYDDDNQASLEKATNLVVKQLSQMLDIPKDKAMAAHLESAVFTWGHQESDSYVKGGYMYPSRGLCPHHLVDIAAPLDGRIFFAGEATNTSACCTIQAAMDTGSRAAHEVQQSLRNMQPYAGS